jgi:hypothetical protein
MKCPKRPTDDDLARVALEVPALPGFTGYGAWVEHIAAPRHDLVSTIIEDVLKIPDVRMFLCMQCDTNPVGEEATYRPIIIDELMCAVHYDQIIPVRSNIHVSDTP